MLIERTTRDGNEIVVLRYAAVFYWLMWPTLLLTAIASTHSATEFHISAAIAWALLLCAAIPYWPVIFELKRKMRDNTVGVSGSKYSLANPLTYSWKSVDRGDSVH